MTNKKKNIAVVSVIAALVLIIGIACLVRFLGGKNPNEVGNDTAKNVEVSVATEEELREMLLKDAIMTITVTDDIVVEEGFIVNGQKTLKGDAAIEMYIGAPFDQSILTVSPDATLIMDGLVLDGNHLADGILVSDGAELTYLSGEIIYTETFGIIADGDVTIKDVLIDHAQEGTVRVGNGANVSMEGGTISNTWYGGVYIENGGNMTISGNSVFDGSVFQSLVHNEGNLKITGGTFMNSGAYGVRNYNKLEIAYEGKEADGYIEFTSNSRAAIRTEEGSESVISNIHVYDTRSNALVSVGGETTITDSKIEKTPDHALEVQKGHVIAKNIEVIETSAGAGIYAGATANVEAENCTIIKPASNGIAASSGTITATGIKIVSPERYGVASGNATDKEPSSITITDSQIMDAGKFGVYAYGTSDVKVVSTEISGFTREETTGIFVATKASCTLEGSSVVKDAKQRGVKVQGTFTMNGGNIQRNFATLNGAGMYVGPKATFTMNGGQISNNLNSTKNAGGIIVDGGKVTIDGGKLNGNSTSLSGGAIYAYNGGNVYLKSGEINGNVAGTAGDGIYFKGENTKVTVGKGFYMGDNDIRVATTEVILDIESDSLTKHSASKPLLVTPADTFEEGTKVVRCTSAAAATKLTDVVKSGDGSFKLNKNDKYYEIEYTKADMDMTGADTVQVSNFAEFKAAVTGTTSKRYVILKANIPMETSVRVPGGTTVCIKDDGTARTLSRAAGMTGKFLTTLYGTGLYLEGTKDGNLILDGTCPAGANPDSCDSLVYAAGSTVVKGVVFKNNGTATAESRTRGAFLNQWHGDISVYNSSFTNGKAYTAGAMVVGNASGYVENSTFTDNRTFTGGGAIRLDKSGKLEIVSSTFARNTAGSTGGAIVSTGAKKLTVTDTTFDSNKALTGGAVRVMGTDNYAFFTGSEGSQAALFTNNSADNGASGNGGAIYADGSTQVMVDGYSFTKNTASGYGGAVYGTNKKSYISLSNSTFYENHAGNSGGAVTCNQSQMDIISCELGKENAGNTADSKGGAVIVMGSGTVKMSLGGGSDYQTMAYNSAKIGGAVCVYKGTFSADRYTFANNSAQNGAGMYIYADGLAETSNSLFKENAATQESGNNYGGAVCVYGPYSAVDDTYEANLARVGGAIYIATGMNAEFSGTSGLFKGNISTGGNGNAICAFTDSTMTVDGYTFEDNNSSTGKGSAVVVYGNQTAEIKNTVFAGNTQLYGRTGSRIVFSNLKGANLVHGQAGALFIASDKVAEDSQLSITPYEYTPGTVILGKTDDLSDEAWEATRANIEVVGKADGMVWKIDEEGKLQTGEDPVASITDSDGTQYYYSLTDAVDVANTKGGTGEAAPIVITVEKDVVLADALTIRRNTVIQNKANKEVTISRGHNGNLFVVNAGVTFQLGSTDTEDKGQLILDGTWTVDGVDTAVSTRMVYVKEADSIFVLQKNATLQNANSTASGAALVNFGTCHLYGNMLNNVSSGGSSTAYGAGAILQCRGSSSLTIYGGTYTGNSNSGTYGGGGVIGTQTTTTAGEAGPITIAGGTFSENSAAYGGVIFTYTEQAITINGGTFSKNVANTNGGVIATLTGTATAYPTIVINGGTFESNTAVTTTSSYGGVIWADRYCKLTIGGGTFTGNSATCGGVIYMLNQGELIVKKTSEDANQKIVFEQNEGTRYGAGVVFVGDGAKATISDVVMTGNCAAGGNAAYYGGGAIVLHGAATVTISGCEISGNAHVGTLSDTAKNEDGLDIAFSGQGSNKTQTLILSDGSFNGIVGHRSNQTTATLKLQFSDGSTPTVERSTRYKVDSAAKTLTKIQ